MQNQVTTYIGRFSLFHLGQSEVLLRALKGSEVVVLLIGSSHQARNIKNPFTYEERREVIRDWFSSEVLLAARQGRRIGKLVVLPLQDYPYNDQKWIREVQAQVVGVRNENNIPDSWPNILTGANRDESTWYLKVFGDFFKTDFVGETSVGFDLSSTVLRNDLFSGGNAWEYKTPEATQLFLDGFVRTSEFTTLKAEYEFIKKYRKSWEAAPYAPTFVTVDACVIQSGHVLLVTRDEQPGKGLLALPGGFVEQTEKLVDAAVRELKEETSIQLSDAQLYGSIHDKEIFDHPNRSLRGRTITTCFLFKLRDGFALPKVKPQKGEVSKVKFYPIAEVQDKPWLWFEDHHPMFSTMLDRIKN